jgi:penicillin-binding protein 1A
MRQTGVISEKEAQQAKDAPLVLAELEKEAWRAPYFVKYVKALLEDMLGQEALYRRGLTVYTTLDPSKQSFAEKVLKSGLEQLETRINQNSIASKKYPQGALICLHALQGSILAMVGGRDFDESPFNRATQALRQPGSAFKPMVYAYAIEQGFAQNETLWDGPIMFKGGGGEENWVPVNFSDDYKGEMSLRWALAVSENIPAVKLLNKLGVASVAQFAHTMGITSLLRPNLTLALGASEVTLLELTAAYALFPNQGV